MGLKTSSETEQNKVEMTLVVDREAFDAAVGRAFRKNVNKISIPGFRKGKAPRGIIEKFYGKTFFFEDALNDILPAEIDAAVKETGFSPADMPYVENVDFENEEGILVTAAFIRVPDVKLGDYKAIKAVRQTVRASDQDVEKELERIRARYSRAIDITDRPAQTGDTVDIDYEGFAGGVPFEGGKADGHKLKLGSGAFIPGFEEQISGKKIGEEFDVNVTFPHEYHAEELKGKDALFNVKLNGITFEELPVLDDEFAKDASEFDTLDEYKADIKATINKKNSEDADRRLDEDISAALCGLVEADIPDVMFEKEIDRLVREYDYSLRNQGFTLEMFMQYTGMKMEDLRERYREGAVMGVKRQLALGEISKTEGVAPTDEEITARYQELANQYNMKPEEVRTRLPEEEIKDELTVTKAFELVKRAASVTEKTVTEEELAKQAQKKRDAASDQAGAKAEKPKSAKKPVKAGDSAKTETTAKAKEGAKKQTAGKTDAAGKKIAKQEKPETGKPAKETGAAQRKSAKETGAAQRKSAKAKPEQQSPAASEKAAREKAAEE